MLTQDVDKAQTYKAVSLLYNKCFKTIKPFRVNFRYLIDNIQDRETLTSLINQTKDNEVLLAQEGNDLEQLKQECLQLKADLKALLSKSFSLLTTSKYEEAEQKLSKIERLLFSRSWLMQLKFIEKNFKTYEMLAWTHSVKDTREDVHTVNVNKQAALREFVTVAHPVNIPEYVIAGRQYTSIRERIAYGLEPNTWLEDIAADSDRYINQVLKMDGKALIG